jgi:hypothetical protein
VDVREDELPSRGPDEVGFLPYDRAVFHADEAESAGAVPFVVRRLEVNRQEGRGKRWAPCAVRIQGVTP